MKQTFAENVLRCRFFLLPLLLAGCFAGASGEAASAKYEGPALPVWTAPDAIPSKPGRQVYRVDPKTAAVNAAKVAGDTAALPAWKNAPAVYYIVDPLSDIRRTPDLYPVDGRVAGTLEIIAAKGEFEPASFMVYAKKNADKFTLKISDLKNAKTGAVIPASALDPKLVKVWYQCGAGWCGEFSDPLGRILVPEILLNDEKLIFVDPATQDNYARYSNKDGSETYEWISADFQVTDYKLSNMVRIDMLKDADTLQPVVLNKDEFKQFMVTARVPKNAAGGVYEGTIALNMDGKEIGKIPVRLGVLNFELPDAATHHDINKPIYMWMGLYGRVADKPAILKNLIEHNAPYINATPKVNPAREDEFVRDIELVRKAGGKLRPIFLGGPNVGSTFWRDTLNESDKISLEYVRKNLKAAAELSKKYLGHTDVYCYGVDEGGYEVIKAERPTWHAAHAAGLKTQASALDHKRNLYSLDYIQLPRMPNNKDRRESVSKFHESHPNGLCDWYADPHFGPENPDYMRRLHGLNAYYAGYDVIENYIWYRNDWNDMAVAYEPNYRGIILVYAISDRILDTLAWEGLREGVDDVRYATKLRQLAYQAEKSPNADTLHLGRLALGYLAYWDTKENPDTFRMECINYIVQLEKALQKEQK